MATLRSKNRKGYSIIEILVAIFVFVTISTTLIYLLIEIGTANQQEKYRLTAIALSQEGLEATRNIRDSGWNTISDGTFGLAKVANSWALSGQSDVDPSGQFTRQITISSQAVDRRLVTSTVSYNFSGLRNITISSSTYLTNWRKVIEPETPTWEDPEIRAILGTGFTGNNKNPRDIFVSGNFAYLVTAETNANDPEFFVYNISDPSHPVVDGYFKASARINSVYIVGEYAFLATEKDDAEFIVLKVDDPKNIRQVESADVPRNYNGLDVFVSNGYAYLLTETSTLGKELSIFDVSNPELIANQPVGNFTFGFTPRSIFVSGNLAYVGTDSDAEEIVVLNIENKSSPTKVGSYNLSGSSDVYAIKAQGNSLYVGTDVNSGANPEFYILHANIDNPANVTISVVGQLKIGGRINSLAINVVGNRVFLATNLGTEEFYVVDVSNPSIPTRKSSVDLPDIAIGLDFNGSNVFVADINNGQELIIIGP